MKSVLRFLIVGGIATIIDYIVYMRLSGLLDISAAKVSSMLVASVFSYYLNKRWTFENKDRTNWKYLSKYYIAFFINVAVNTFSNRITYYFCVDRIEFSELVGKTVAFVIATGAAMIVNFLLQHFWVFNKKKKEKR